MKLRYLFSILSACLLLSAGCQQEPIGSLENLKLSSTYLVLPQDGGEVALQLSATEDWAFQANDSENNEVWPRVLAYQKGSDNKPIEGADGKYLIDESKTVPSWLTLKSGPMGGAAGEYTLVFAADATQDGRELELQILCGNLSQYFRVRQGNMEVAEATVAEINAGPNGKTYRVTGKVESIAKKDYGNWYLVDDKGDKLYIFGTLDKEGKTKNFESLDIGVGDIVTVEGPKDTYNGTVELVNVTVLEIVKSLVKITDAPAAEFAKEGGEYTVKLAYKGDGVMPSISEDFRSWISIFDIQRKAGVPSKLDQNPADTAIVKFIVQKNELGDRTGEIVFTSADAKSSSSVAYSFTQKGSILPTVISEFMALEDNDPALWRVSGWIKSISVSEQYGNGEIVMIDGMGNELKLYRVVDADKGIAALNTLKVGDYVTAVGNKGSYNGAAQMIQGCYVESSVANTEVSIADFIAAEVNSSVYYRVTGTIKSIKEISASYKNANLTITDGANDLYLYSVGPGVSGTKIEDLGLEVGKVITVVGVRAEYDGPQMGSGQFVQFVEAVEPISISEAVELEDDCVVEGKVLLKNQKGILITDGTDVLYGYLGSEPSVEVGDVVSMEGKVTYYNKGGSMSNPTVTKVEATVSDYTAPTPAELTAEKFAELAAGDFVTPYVTITGTVSLDTYNNLIISLGEYSIKSYYDYADFSAYDGKSVKVTGYAYTIKNNQLSLLVKSVEEVE